MTERRPARPCQRACGRPVDGCTAIAASAGESGVFARAPYSHALAGVFRLVTGVPPMIDILLAIAGASAAVTNLLLVIRDWAARRRRALAQAKDAEDQAKWRAELRKWAARRMAEGKEPFPQWLMADLFSPELLTDASRLPEALPPGEGDSPGHRLPVRLSVAWRRWKRAAFPRNTPPRQAGPGG